MMENIWEDDLLDREKDAEYLAAFLINRSNEIAKRGIERSYVLNVNARWGDGKTFFLQRFQQSVEAKGHLAVYVDAWRDDFADDPLIAVMAAIDEAVKKQVRSKLANRWEVVRKKGVQVARLLGKGLLTRALGFAVTTGVASAVQKTLTSEDADDAQGLSPEGAGSIAESVGDEASQIFDKVMNARAESAVSDFTATKKMISEFRDGLAKFIDHMEKDAGKSKPMFVFIDELDRCRPTYAIAMLERVKHLFDTPNIVFVVATDRAQLVHSIGAVYGAGFDGGRYLKRFFDRSFEFGTPSTKEFVANLFATAPIDSQKLSSPLKDDHQSFVTEYFEHAGIDLRSIEQIYDGLRTIASAWPEMVPLELLLLLPLLNGHYSGTLDLTEHSSIGPFLRDKQPSSWMIDTFQDDGSGMGRHRKRVGFGPAATKMWEQANRSLWDSVTASVPNLGIDEWSLQRLKIEHGVRFRGQQRADEFQPSLITKYPDIIRMAGRLRQSRDA